MLVTIFSFDKSTQSFDKTTQKIYINTSAYFASTLRVRNLSYLAKSNKYLLCCSRPTTFYIVRHARTVTASRLSCGTINSVAKTTVAVYWMQLLKRNTKDRTIINLSCLKIVFESSHVRCKIVLDIWLPVATRQLAE